MADTSAPLSHPERGDHDPVSNTLTMPTAWNEVRSVCIVRRDAMGDAHAFHVSSRDEAINLVTSNFERTFSSFYNAMVSTIDIADIGNTICIDMVDFCDIILECITKNPRLLVESPEFLQDMTSRAHRAHEDVRGVVEQFVAVLETLNNT